jgi:hypothetical protein
MKLKIEESWEILPGVPKGLVRVFFLAGLFFISRAAPISLIFPWFIQSLYGRI